MQQFHPDNVEEIGIDMWNDFIHKKHIVYSIIHVAMSSKNCRGFFNQYV